MNITFNIISMPIAVLIMLSLTIIPVKIGADLFGAPNNAIKHCVISVLLQMVAVIFLFIIAKGFLMVVFMFVAVSMIYWQVLKISFVSSFVFTMFIFIIQISLMQFLSKIPLLIM